MKRIFKYGLVFQDKITVELPVKAEILSIVTQNDMPFLYALIDDKEKQTEKVTIICHGTGHPANDIVGRKFLGTLNIMGGSLMFHYFKGESR